MKDNIKFGKSSEILTTIIDSQKPSSSKSGVGFGRNLNNNKSFKGFIKEGDDIGENEISKEVNKLNDVHKPHYNFLGYCYSCSHFGHRAIECRTTKQHMNDWKRPYHRHEYFSYSFNGYCFSCNKFGHKALNCRTVEVKKIRLLI